VAEAIGIFAMADVCAGDCPFGSDGRFDKLKVFNKPIRPPKEHLITTKSPTLISYQP